MVTKNTISDIVDALKLECRVSKIILFGSYAYGNPRPESDIDLLVLIKTLDDPISELIALKKKLLSPEYSLDLVLMSEEEYGIKMAEGWTLMKDIAEKGIVLYAA